MTSPAVVILTEPAHCELAGSKTLVDALLQVQQLASAGVPVSQAFCDHPADAMKFIDAYAKAYPELQLQSSDLPLPEHLYSMIADGRLSPLQAPDATPENAKLEESGRLYPLYVLSLGKPEGLMQALQDNGFANSGIHVIEIAPVEELSADPVTVAEAVANASLGAPSWLPESSTASDTDDQGLLPLEESAHAPLKLESIELDLDYVHIDEDIRRSERSESAAAIVDTTPVIPAIDAADAHRSGRDDAPTEGGKSADARQSEPTPAAPAAVEPVPEERDTARNEPDDDDEEESSAQLGSSFNTDPTRPEIPDAPGADLEDVPPAASAGDPGDVAAPPGSIDDPDAPDDPVEIAASDTTERHQDITDDIHSFSDPGGDVLYPPTGSFASDDDDFPYPLPTGGAPEPGTFDHVLGLSADDDVLDLEAIGRHLPDPVDDPADHLDLILTRPPGQGEFGAHGLPGPHPAPHYADGPDSDHDEMATIPHDLDI